MTVTFETYLIICPLLFLAGFIDAIGGGGGLISLPAYLFAGLPPHMAIGTNKLSSACGTSLVTLKLVKNRMVNAKLAVPSIIMAFLGAGIGAKLSLLVNEKILYLCIIALLPLCAFVVLNKKLFSDNSATGDINSRRTLIVVCIAAFIIGLYDGFYGPGTGTFLIIAFTVFAKIAIQNANAQAKVINLTTNITALTVFFLNGQVLIWLGLAGAVFNMIGGYIGVNLMLKNGSKIVRPTIILVLAILFAKVLIEFFK